MVALRRFSYVIASVALFATTVAVASVLGSSARQAGSTSGTQKAATAGDAYRIITEQGGYGRELVLFDKQSNVLGRSVAFEDLIAGRSMPRHGRPSELDLTSELIASGTIRSVLLIVPDDLWPEYSKSLKGNFITLSSANGDLYRRFAGAPVRFVAASDAPAPPRGERVITLVRSSLASAYPQALLQQYTAPEAADLVVLWEAER